MWALPREDLPDDFYTVTRSFRLHADNPPNSLKEFFMSMMLDVEGYGEILQGMRGPVVERLGVVLPFRNHWIPTEFDELVVALKDGERDTAATPFFAMFQSLAEHCLPCNGVSATSMDTLAELLSHALALQHLWFDTAHDPDILPDAALKYSRSISTLVSVSWKDQATFEVKQPGGLDVVELERKPYAAPTWQEWRGIGKWWEMEAGRTWSEMC
ncbi:hypothetical protein B0H15DRAFT_460889 [Mycena belliarum]|uniref:Uncharacterized protein n=1 Tax=Mycena belliarum TaxID=1033014 RepID=A0AAD6UFE7_9AGAR|nr:hypothetical protein B0H15DRAFT_460889 [Mycena belliae]